MNGVSFCIAGAAADHAKRENQDFLISEIKHLYKNYFGISVMKYLFCILFVTFIYVPGVQSETLWSPNKKIKVTIETKYSNAEKFGQPQFKIDYFNDDESIEALPFSPLGITTADQSFSDNLKYVGASSVVSIHHHYEMLTGKKRIRENLGNEKRFTFVNDNNVPIEIVFRAYNDGVAFKYHINNTSQQSTTLTGELTSYTIPPGTKRWLQEYKFYYEGYYPFSRTGAGRNFSREWGYPALFETNDGVFLLVSEADVGRDTAATKLTNRENLDSYKVTYPGPQDKAKPGDMTFQLPWSSAWRVLMVGELTDIVSSTLITDLSEPNKLQDTSWIKPGAASWIYWANNRGSKDYKKLVEYVDLAVEMEWPYTLIDWEWDVMANGGNLEDLVRYANSKGVKPLLWFNSGTSWLDPTPVDALLTPEKRRETFTWLNKIGVHGIKVDFFEGDQKDTINYYIDILEDAAKYKLLVNFHGSTIPRGWQRTYPHLMTLEGVYGSEWYNNVPTFTEKAAAHNATLPFTRNVIGPMDYGPVTFTNSQHPHITSYAHELALSVIFESGLQHFADRPSGYYGLPKEPKEFLKSFPTVWDETILLDGYPGESVLMARRTGNKWYVAGINGTNDSKTFVLNFPFLNSGKHKIAIIKDGDNDKSFATERKTITRKSELTVATLPRGGFVGLIE